MERLEGLDPDLLHAMHPTRHDVLMRSACSRVETVGLSWEFGAKASRGAYRSGTVGSPAFWRRSGVHRAAACTGSRVWAWPTSVASLTSIDCTGWRAVHALAARFPGSFIQNSVGTRMEALGVMPVGHALRRPLRAVLESRQGWTPCTSARPVGASATPAAGSQALRGARHGALGVYALQVALVTAAYYVAGRIGLELAYLDGLVAAVWPPAGLGLAVLFLYGVRLWPGIVIGDLLLGDSRRRWAPSSARPSATRWRSSLAAVCCAV